MSTVEQENEIERARQLSEYRRVRDAFLSVFGPPGKRTPHGEVILAKLERFTNWGKPIREEDTTGQTDIYRTGRKAGRVEVMAAIHQMIEWRESDHEHTSSPSTE
jgi:hypothetical protein